MTFFLFCFLLFGFFVIYLVSFLGLFGYFPHILVAIDMETWVATKDFSLMYL